jgi:ribosomal protein S2
MKLKKKLIKKKLNQTNFYLLKYKIYQDFHKTQNLTLLNLLKNIEFSLKQSFEIIINYSIRRKTILFLGLPYVNKNRNIEKFKHLNHIFLPKRLWSKGSTAKIFRYKKLPDLVVFFDKLKKDSSILKEFEDLNIPVIIFDNSITVHSSTGHYTILGNLNKKHLKKFFQILIYSVFKYLNLNIFKKKKI